MKNAQLWMQNLLIIFFLVFAQAPYAQQSQNEHKMDWFGEAKLGIFIHWGLYAVDGISESWSFYNEYISHEDYLKQLGGFTAKDYNPKKWAQLIAESGAQYSIITTKHHDGFALWDTQYGTLNAAQHSPAKRDLITPFVQAIRKKGLRVGLYFSLPDWSFEDYTHFTTNKKRYTIEEDPQRWAKYLNYMNGQLAELKTRYAPDIWWFDGDWEHQATEWDSSGIREFLSADQPQVIFNSRLNGKGDYATPEIGVPVYRPKDSFWELCMTINDSWGYQGNDTNYKSPMQVIDIFVDCISKGGNLLLNISPKADGTIPDQQSHLLKELGRWTKKHEAAIYKTQRGIAYEHFYGPTALSNDRKTLFVFVRDYPKDGKIVIKGLSNTIHRAYVVGNGTILEQQKISKVYWNRYPGIDYISIPKSAIDPYYTVVALVLDGPIKMYSENNGAVESN
ncbi:MAG: alpha-L-fucosidase [Flavobacteriaceae bacterium]